MENNISKDFRVSIFTTIEEADIILNALAEKALRIEDLRQYVYDSVNEQVKMVNPPKEEEKVKKRKEKQVMENIKLVCKDCKKEFDFTVGEQRFYEEKGFASPIRCKECRDAKKARNLEREQANSNTEETFEDMLKRFQANTVKIEK